MLDGPGKFNAKAVLRIAIEPDGVASSTLDIQARASGASEFASFAGSLPLTTELASLEKQGVVRFAATNPTATLSFVKSADQDSIAWVEELKFKQLPNRMAMIDLGLKAISSGKHAAVPKNVRLRGELPVTCKLIGADRLVREDVMLKTSECVNAVTALSARSFVSAYHE